MGERPRSELFTDEWDVCPWDILPLPPALARVLTWVLFPVPQGCLLRIPPSLWHRSHMNLISCAWPPTATRVFPSAGEADGCCKAASGEGVRK